MKAKDIDIFRRQAQYLGLKPGVTFADLGASSGYHDGAMAVYTDGVTYYLNDIDQHCLNTDNMKKMLKYYSSIRGSKIEKSNRFHLAIGSSTRTGLPANTFDVIFMNATLHVLDHPDSILTDVKRKLKSGGYFYVRDEMVYDGTPKVCDPKRCGHPILQYNPFIAMMTRNGFRLEEKNDEFGHPIFKFSFTKEPF